MRNSSPDNPVDDDDWADYEDSEATPGYSGAEWGNRDIIGSGYTRLCTLCGARDEFERCPCNGADI